ncbi:uncharacterized protein BJX67DRAFT_337862 [Aspergillus lucknowensis]|uniref:HNH nuclease domain-containing protein n=1 Tax=Aspergillus lucknowensis TaxID=176173 RepID=A0ABR4L5W1_9EURO
MGEDRCRKSHIADITAGRRLVECARSVWRSLTRRSWARCGRLDAIFGKKHPAELFSPKNGILVPDVIECWFDAGKLVIVPYLPDWAAPMKLLSWVRGGVREYRCKIIDPSWENLDRRITMAHSMTWRELDGKRVEFRSNFRPAARYVYCHYCTQVLRRAWGHNQNGGALPIWSDEVGRPFWVTPGWYLPRNMLLAIVEELGHSHKELLRGTGCDKGDKNLLLEAVSTRIRRRPALKDHPWIEAGDEEGEEGMEEMKEIDDNDIAFTSTRICTRISPSLKGVDPVLVER